MTKYAGMEGSGIIAMDYEKRLNKVCTEEELTEAKNMLSQVSVVRDGITAGKIGTAGMHDITEGGVLGAVWEMCQIAGLGCELWIDKIPVNAVTMKICRTFNIDYLRLISSGCMLIIVKPEKKKSLEDAMLEAGILISCIGVVKKKEFGIMQCEWEGAELKKISPPESDELYKVVG